MSVTEGAPAPAPAPSGSPPATPGATGSPPASGSQQPSSGSQPLGVQGGEGVHNDGGNQSIYWPQDWRDRLSGVDPKAKPILDRYGSPEDLVKKLINQEEVIRKRPAAPPPRPGADATLEEKAAWRAQMGLPAEPTGYIENLQLSDGRVLGQDDMPVAEHFVSRMHEIGASQEVINAAVDSVLDYTEEMQANQQMEDERFRREARDMLRDEFGQEYKRKMSFIAPVFGGNRDLQASILSSRGPDGRLIGDRPEVIQWLVDLGQQIDPEASIGAGGSSSLQSVETELATLQTMMKDDAGPYWRGPMAEKHQARFGDLIAQRDRIRAKAERNSR